MVVPFGVSVGDFIARLGVIYTCFKSLSHSGGSSQDCLAAIKTIGSLELALLRVQALYDQILNPQQRVALEEEVRL